MMKIMMMSSRNLIVLVLLSSSSSTWTTSAFLYSPQAHENLAILSKNIDTEQMLQLKLDVGLSSREQQQQQVYGNQARLALQGPILKLSTHAGGNNNNNSNQNRPSAVALPGATQAKHLSTGSLELDVIQPASYVSIQGLQTVPMEKACWEMIWLEDQENGKFTCAFDLPVPVHRNGVTLSAGPMYVTFSIYTAESLAVAQARKHTTVHHYNQLLKVKQEELAKSNQAKNPLMKALHYQRAFAALDQMILLPTVSHIPETNRQVVPIHHGNVLVVQEGIVWRKSGNPYFGGLIGPTTERIGKAFLTVARPPQQEQQQQREDEDRQNRLRRLGP